MTYSPAGHDRCIHLCTHDPSKVFVITAMSDWKTVDAPQNIGLTDIVKQLSACKYELKKSIGKDASLTNSGYLKLRHMIKSLEQVSCGGRLQCSSVQRKLLAKHFKRVTAEGYVSLLPNQLGVAGKATRTFLASKLFTFVENFNGIWVGFDQLEPSVGGNMAGFTTEGDTRATIIVKVRARCLLFVPKVDAPIYGTVKLLKENALVVDVVGISDLTIVIPDDDVELRKTCEAFGKKRWVVCLMKKMHVAGLAFGDQYNLEGRDPKKLVD
eukprot:GHVH01013587.1.p1 GENE.GHVH01013587.1~~GHVH01013587.1.p1  ORF type:complete len:269 (-),score=39.25 GHVH01013587.1:11-817(-)